VLLTYQQPPLRFMPIGRWYADPKPHFRDYLTRPSERRSVLRWLADWTHLEFASCQETYFGAYTWDHPGPIPRQKAQRRFPYLLEKFTRKPVQPNSLKNKLLEAALEPAGFEIPPAEYPR